MAQIEIISEYHERIRGLLDRRLTLLRDSVRVVGTVRGSRGEGAVMLADLNPSPHRMWNRSVHYHWSLALLLILSPILIVPFAVTPPNFVLLSIAVVIYLPAIYYFVQSLKCHERALFLNRSGVVGLDLWRAGPDVERFQDFVAAVERQISEQS